MRDYLDFAIDLENAEVVSAYDAVLLRGLGDGSAKAVFISPSSDL